MRRVLLSLCLIGTFCLPAEGQLFSRFRAATSSCPDGNCPTAVQSYSVQTFAPVKTTVSQTVTRVTYPIRGNWWSGCNNWQHMTVGEHAGKFDEVWLSQLSWSELQSLHSDAHDGRIRWGSVVRAVVRRSGQAVANVAQVSRDVVVNALQPNQQSVIFLSPAYSLPTPTPIVFGNQQPTLAGIAGVTDISDVRDRAVFRWQLRKAALKGSAEARAALQNAELFGAAFSGAKEMHSDQLAQGKFTDFLAFVLENQEQIIALIKVLMALFADAHAVLFTSSEYFVLAAVMVRHGITV